MKNVILLRRFLFLAVLSLFIVSCDKDENDELAKNDDQLNIVQTAASEEVLSSLVAALAKADEKEGTDLITTLSGDGPFTVFAPTNEAFTALLGSLDGFDSLEDFDTDEEKDLLATILTYHVVAGTAAKSTDLSNGQKIETFQGEEVTINLEGGVFIQDATDSDASVVIADVMTSNGVVHVINKVLLPQAIIDALNSDDEEEEDESGTLVDIVVGTESLSILEAAVLKAELAETLSSEGPFTVFAPSDDAFVALLNVLGDDYNSLDDFDTEEELMLLKDILLYHVLAAEVKASDLSEGSVPTALTDNSIHVIASEDTFVIGDASDVDANITGTDIIASNGVAHTIDKVLLPQSAIDFVASLTLKTIVEIAVATDDLSLLVGALQQANAGLVETLGGDGP
ncbi:MAG: fasciclin domain-containing protein, partial [Maribacter sp.]|nr:fasciclin domain-containing protein [Maribacter sp.]